MEAPAKEASKADRASCVGFFELLLLQPDGRRPLSFRQSASQAKGTGVPKDLGVEPYMLNLCVARRCRRLGLGRAMLGLAEQIVRETWDSKGLYLHVDSD